MELNEIKLSQSIAAAQRVSKYSDHDVYVNCLGDLEIRNAKGTLTEEDISSDLCLNLFALIITNMKRTLKAERLAEALWPDDVVDNPYRSVSNIAYRLRRILSIIDLEDLIIGRHGTFVINPEYNISNLCSNSGREHKAPVWLPCGAGEGVRAAFLRQNCCKNKAEMRPRLRLPV